jgi:hypothetical protein
MGYRRGLLFRRRPLTREGQLLTVNQMTGDVLADPRFNDPEVKELVRRLHRATRDLLEHR